MIHFWFLPCITGYFCSRSLCCIVLCFLSSSLSSCLCFSMDLGRSFFPTNFLPSKYYMLPLHNDLLYLFHVVMCVFQLPASFFLVHFHRSFLDCFCSMLYSLHSSFLSCFSTRQLNIYLPFLPFPIVIVRFCHASSHVCQNATCLNSVVLGPANNLVCLRRLLHQNGSIFMSKWMDFAPEYTAWFPVAWFVLHKKEGKKERLCLLRKTLQ